MDEERRLTRTLAAVLPHLNERHRRLLLAALEALVEPPTRGEPRSPVRWTSKSPAHLAAALTQQGHPSSASGVRRLLHAADYRVQAPAQVQDLHDQITAALAPGLPVISGAPKKQEVGGRYTNGDRAWPPQGDPAPVPDHALPDPVLGQAIP